MRLLVVRACAVGDFVLHLPALTALAAARPGARFTLVGYPGTLDLGRDFLPVDAIHSIEMQPWAGLFAGPVPELGRAGFDEAWVWMKDPLMADNLRQSGVPVVHRRDPFPASGHAATHLLETVGLPAPSLPDLWEPGSERVILHPGSGSPAKVWPYFEELARALPEAAVLVGPCETFGGPNPRLENLSLRQVAAALRECRLFIGNDSGITHLAAYCGAPAIALFGPTNPGVWGPLGRRVRVIHKPSLADITLDEVLRFAL